MLRAIALGELKKGQKVSVRLPNGKVRQFIAATNSINREVVVIGNRVIGSEQRSRFSRTEEFFANQNSFVAEEEQYPWAYLFSIDDFQDLDLTIGYTDESWDLDDVEGHFKSFGGGAARFDTEEQMYDYYNQFLWNDNLYRFNLLIQQVNSVNILAKGVQYFGFDPNRLFADTLHDGVYFGNRVFRTIFPDRQYWFFDVNQTQYTIFYVSNDERYSLKLTVSNDGSFIEKRAIYFTAATTGRYTIDENGQVDEVYRGFNATQISEKRSELIGLIDAVTGAVSPPNFTELTGNLHNRVFTGQELLDEAASVVYSSSDNFPKTIPTNIGTVFRNTNSVVIKTSTLYLLPIAVKRNPGLKSIYAQVRQSDRVLLHQIPSFETWDGYISPLPNKQVEIVLRCGKKHRFETTSFGIYYNYNNGLTSFDREWAQTRVYRFSAAGELKQEQIYNNPEPIIIDDNNWQKPWLVTWQDWRTLNEFRYLSGDYNYVNYFNRYDNATDLLTSYRNIFSQLLNQQRGEISNTELPRLMLETTGFGTLTTKGFVYLEPTSLFDKNVELDYSFSFTSFLVPNNVYSIFSGLARQNTTKSVYYQTTGTYIDNVFDPGIAIEQSTIFPKLDLQEIELPDIRQQDWGTDFGVDFDLRSFALAAIAYLG